MESKCVNLSHCMQTFTCLDLQKRIKFIVTSLKFKEREGIKEIIIAMKRTCHLLVVNLAETDESELDHQMWQKVCDGMGM